MRTLLLTTSLIYATALKNDPVKPPGVLAAHLRGSEVYEVAAKPAGKMVTDGRGDRGHFYYSDGCEDCVYKGAGCGCEPVVEYFACLTKFCHKANQTKFAEKCVDMGDKCTSELDIDCSGPATVCKSKFHQLPLGGVGLSVAASEDNAYCGPHGKCIGKIRMNVEIHNAPKAAAVPKATVAAVAGPASGPAASPSAAPAPSAPPAPPAPPVWLECGLPSVAKADVNVKKDWVLCQVEVKGDRARCDLPMFKELEAGGSKKGYCVLTDGKDGKRLTQPAMSKIINVHKKTPAAKPAEKPKEEKPKPPLAAKSIVTEASITQDSDKLPWMVEKEKRAAAREAAAAKKAEEDKKAEKVEKKEEKTEEKKEKKEVKKDLGNQDDKLPWMRNKANDKPAPPGVDAIVGPK